MILLWEGPLPAGQWHFIGGYRYGKTKYLETLRKEYDMTEKKSGQDGFVKDEPASVRKKAIAEIEEHYKNGYRGVPSWSENLSEPIKQPKIVCGWCGEKVSYGSREDHDITIIHHCKVDREYLDTMKLIVFKVLGIEDPEEFERRMRQMMPQQQMSQDFNIQVPSMQEVLKTAGVPDDEIERQRLENEAQGEKMMKAIRKANNKNMTIKEFKNLNEEFQEYKKAKK
jgi:hypothetical protein